MKTIILIGIIFGTPGEAPVTTSIDVNVSAYDCEIIQAALKTSLSEYTLACVEADSFFGQTVLRF